MLKRIASTGVNLVVLGVSVGIFLVAFIALNALGAAQKPPTISVLSATRDLNIGDVLTANDLEVKTVFQDDNASLYIPGAEVTDVVGGVVAQPIFNGQPIFRSAILAQAAEGTRLSAVLAQYPGYSLFPLPLDAMNLVAPDAEAFLPGDLIGVTVVISTRPQQLSTPTPKPDLVIVNKFGKTECEGGGCRSLIAEAIELNVPVLVAVPVGNLEDWRRFAGGFATEYVLDDVPVDGAHLCRHLALIRNMRDRTAPATPEISALQ